LYCVYITIYVPTSTPTLFPTRRSSDLFIKDLIKKGYIQERIKTGGKGGKAMTSKLEQAIRQRALNQIFGQMRKGTSGNHKNLIQDRKSTRLNSSHVSISYAVFCLKKKQ